MEKSTRTLKAVIIGASGASGRDLVKELLESPAWGEVAVIVRRVLDEWKNLPPTQQEKLKVITTSNLDELSDTKKWDFKGYDSFFCCLGARVKEGKAQYTKVDYTYPTYGGLIAKENGIPHYSIVTTMGADPKSWFFHPRTKGQVEEALANQGLPYLSIFRPGFILDRRNDERFGESLIKYVPFLPKIQAKDISKGMRIDAEKLHLGLESGRKSKVIHENKDILRLVK